MGLLNYTTEVEASKSVGEIIALLAKGGAQHISQQFDGACNCVGIDFSIKTQWGLVGFRLPADPVPVIATLKAQALRGIIPKRFMHDAAQARRVAWRIQKQALEAQLALIELGSVKIEQVMFAYAIMPSTNKTLYDTYKESNFDRLALPEPSKEAA